MYLRTARTNLLTCRQNSTSYKQSYICLLHLFQRFTVSLYHCFTVSLVYCFTVSLFHCYTVMLFRCYTVSLLHCYTVSLFHCFTVSLFHCFTVSLFHCFTVRVDGHPPLACSWERCRAVQKVQRWLMSEAHENYGPENN